MGQTRICLKCNKRFLSKSKYNFLCNKCNEENETERTKIVPLEARFTRVLKKEIGGI
jgi:tRNA(Ile2) C34 agmatinyltransferase TiaS